MFVISAAEQARRQISVWSNAPQHSLNCCPLRVIRMKMRLEMPFNVLVNNNPRLASSFISSLHKVLLCQPSQSRLMLYRKINLLIFFFVWLFESYQYLLYVEVTQKQLFFLCGM